MIADLVPKHAIPELAARANSPEMLRVLQHIQRAGFIRNGNVDRETTDVLRRLMELGLVDAGYEGATEGEPYLWTSNSNGSRVLSYLTGLRAEPHYEIASSELAAWLEQQGEDRWWYVDGDPLLTGRMTFPCPADELAEELRRIDRPLLVQAHKEDGGAKGQHIQNDKLNELVVRFAEIFPPAGSEQTPPGSEDRLLYLCWKDAYVEWLLVEDSATTKLSKADEAARTK